jgi:hypothetical protein
VDFTEGSNIRGRVWPNCREGWQSECLFGVLSMRGEAMIRDLIAAVEYLSSRVSSAREEGFAMVRAYWCIVHRRAFAETAKALGLESRARIMMGALIVVVILLCLAFWGSSDASRDEAIVRLAIAGTVIGLFPFVYAWKLVSTPARMHEEAMQGAVQKLQSLLVEYSPEHPEHSYQYCHDRAHPETRKTTRLYRISVTNKFGRQTSGRLMVQAVRDKFGNILDFTRQSLRSPEATNGDFTLNNEQSIFFDVVAYYKGDPKQVFVCGSIGGAHYPIDLAPFTISIEITGEGVPQQKRYRFNFDENGELTFEEAA